MNTLVSPGVDASVVRDILPVRSAAWLAVLIVGGGSASFGSEAATPPASFHVRHWTSEDGLPQNNVEAVAQTRDGYLWVGTWFGLARFDGVRFVVFNHANTPQLPVEAISALAVDRADGALWIGTPQGLLRFKDGRFERLVETDESSSGEKWDVSELLPSMSGGVWVRAGAKVCHWPTRKDWRKLPFAWAESTKAMWETDDGALEVMTQRRMFRVERDGTMVPHEPPSGFPRNRVWTGAWPQDRSGRFWLATSEELSRSENDQWRIVRALPDRSFPGDRFLEDESGAIWVAHSGIGFWRYTEGFHEPLLLGKRGAEKSIASLFEDREGHIWVGTLQGLFQLRKRLLRTFSVEEGLPHGECWSVSEAPDGALWVKTKRGPARIHGEQVQAFIDEPFPHQTPCILVDKTSRVWMGGEAFNGVVTWLPGTETNSFWRDPRSGAMTGVGLDALYLDRANRVWAGTSRGPMWFEEDKPAGDFGQRGLPTNGIRSIYQTRDGAMWFGTWKAGAVRWNGSPLTPSLSPDGAEAARSEGRATRFTTSDGLADDRVFVFHEDADGALWIGTHNGLSRLKDGRFFTFRRERGLSDNLINWLEEDDFGRLWFSCNRGVFCISRAELNEVAEGRNPRANPIVYGTADGMLSPETNGEHQPAGCKTRDGRIWFPTADGVVVVDPSLARGGGVAPVVVIEQVKADGEVVWGDGAESGQVRKWESESKRAVRPISLSHSPTFSPALRLPPGRARDLQIRYTANSFIEPRRTRFQYRLVSHDAGWREETTERLAVYTNLRPGDYRFELRAANAHGVWSDAPTAFAFSLAPHFWQTWPFYALCGLAIVALAASFTAYRLRWQRRLLSARHAQALADERARIARDLHDDLGTAMTGVALEIDVARRVFRTEHISAGASLAEIASRVRALAERMREVVWAVNPRCDTVPSLASFLEQQAGTLLRGSGVRGRFEFPADIPTLPLDSESRHQLALGVREALTNALRHAQASDVVLAVALRDGALVVSVRDNGRGFDPAEAHRAGGHGLQNLRVRLERLGGRCSVESRPGAGTRVEFCVPINRSLQRKEAP